MEEKILSWRKSNMVQKEELGLHTDQCESNNPHFLAFSCLGKRWGQVVSSNVPCGSQSSPGKRENKFYLRMWGREVTGDLKWNKSTK